MTQNADESSTDSPAATPKIVELLFAKFRALYGVKLADQWAGCDLDEVKASWDEALSDLDLAEVRAGLKALIRAGKPFPPTLPEFYVLCRPRIDIPAVNDHQGLDNLARQLGVSTAGCDSYHELRRRIIQEQVDQVPQIPRLQS